MRKFDKSTPPRWKADGSSWHVATNRPDPAHDHQRGEEPRDQEVSAVRDRSPLYKFGLAEKRCRPNRVTGVVETIWVTTDVDHDSVFAAKVGDKPYYIVIEHSGSLRLSRLWQMRK
jgi:hypothetical protein